MQFKEPFIFLGGGCIKITCISGVYFRGVLHSHLCASILNQSIRIEMKGCFNNFPIPKRVPLKWSIFVASILPNGIKHRIANWSSSKQRRNRSSSLVISLSILQKLSSTLLPFRSISLLHFYPYFLQRGCYKMQISRLLKACCWRHFYSVLIFFEVWNWLRCTRFVTSSSFALDSSFLFLFYLLLWLL